MAFGNKAPNWDPLRYSHSVSQYSLNETAWSYVVLMYIDFKAIPSCDLWQGKSMFWKSIKPTKLNLIIKPFKSIICQNLLSSLKEKCKHWKLLSLYHFLLDFMNRPKSWKIHKLMIKNAFADRHINASPKNHYTWTSHFDIIVQNRNLFIRK